MTAGEQRPVWSTEGHPLGRRERKKLATRRRILEAALGLFEEKGYEATTVEEIAERADVAKGTVFNYFPQKRAFLLAAYWAWVDLLLDRFGPVERWKGPVRAQLERLFGFLVDLLVEHRPIARLVVFETMKMAHERITDGYGAKGTEGRTEGREVGTEGPFSSECRADAGAVRVMESMIQALLEKGRTKGEIRPAVDPAEGASFLAAVVFHTLVSGLVGEASGREIKAALASKLDIIFTGLAP